MCIRDSIWDGRKGIWDGGYTNWLSNDVLSGRKGIWDGKYGIWAGNDYIQSFMAGMSPSDPVGSATISNFILGQ